MDQPLPSRVTTRYGLRVGIFLGVAGCADVALQAWRRALGPEWHFLVLVTYLLLAAGIALCALAGFRAGQASGLVGSGTRAGALAGGLACAGFGAAVSVQIMVGESKPLDALTVFSYAIVCLLFVAIGALAGGVLGALGGTIGRALYRRRGGGEANLGQYLATDALPPLDAAQVVPPAAEPSPIELLPTDEEDLEVPISRWQSVKDTLQAILFLGGTYLLAMIQILGGIWFGDHPLQREPLLGASLIGMGIVLAIALSHVKGWRSLWDWLVLAFVASGVTLIWTSLGLLVGVFAGGLFYQLIMGRVTSRLVAAYKAIMDALQEDAAVNQPVIFRDDGERIVYYPSRRKLGLHAAFCAAIAGISFGSILLFRLESAPAVVIGVFGIFGLIGLAPDLVRMVHRWPSLIVTSDGIVDLSSVHIFGFGLIGWHQIDGVHAPRGNWRRGKFGDLVLLTYDSEALCQRQPLIKRALLHMASLQNFGNIHISSLLLEQSPADISERITAYVKAHAPPGYIEPIEPIEPEDDAEISPGYFRSDDDGENGGEVVH